MIGVADIYLSLFYKILDLTWLSKVNNQSHKEEQSSHCYSYLHIVILSPVLKKKNKLLMIIAVIF